MVPRFPLHFIVLLKTFVRGGPFNTLLLNPVQELSCEEGDGVGGGCLIHITTVTMLATCTCIICSVYHRPGPLSKRILQL